MAIKRLELENVKAVIEKEISSDGRIWGLTEWAGETATIVIQHNTKKTSSRKKK